MARNNKNLPKPLPSNSSIAHLSDVRILTTGRQELKDALYQTTTRVVGRGVGVNDARGVITRGIKTTQQEFTYSITKQLGLPYTTRSAEAIADKIQEYNIALNPTMKQFIKKNSVIVTKAMNEAKRLINVMGKAGVFITNIGSDIAKGITKGVNIGAKGALNIGMGVGEREILKQIVRPIQQAVTMSSKLTEQTAKFEKNMRTLMINTDKMREISLGVPNGHHFSNYRENYKVRFELAKERGDWKDMKLMAKELRQENNRLGLKGNRVATDDEIDRATATMIDNELMANREDSPVFNDGYGGVLSDYERQVVLEKLNRRNDSNARIRKTMKRLKRAREMLRPIG